MQKMTKIKTVDLMPVLDRGLSQIINKFYLNNDLADLIEPSDLAVLKMIQSVIRANCDPYDVYEDMEVKEDDTEGNGD